MGYLIKQTASRFKIVNINILPALQSLRHLAREKKKKDGELRWVGLQGVIESLTLNEALMYCRWFAFVDNEGNVIDIRFHGEKLGDDELILKTIAPYVESGSSIDMEGQDTDVWRWLFQDGTLQELDIRGERSKEQLHKVI
jgi:hypothetical protein